MWCGDAELSLPDLVTLKWGYWPYRVYVLFLFSSALFSDVFAGSLLKVENYQLVVERFLKTDFPSWEYLENLKHVREKQTRWVPLFSVQVKSSLSSSMSILDHGKASCQHSISVPKQLFFAICIKRVLSQQQTHHLPFVQSMCSLGAALHTFPLLLLSTCGALTRSAFPNKCLFWTATCQEQGVSLLPFVVSVSMCSSTWRMFRFSMLLKDKSREALGAEKAPLWGRRKMAAQHLSWKPQRQKCWNWRIPRQILAEMRTVRGSRAAPEQGAVCLTCSWLPRKRVSCCAITNCPQKKIRKHRSSSAVSKPRCCGWADHGSGATPEKLGIYQSWRRLALMEKRAWHSKKWGSFGVWFDKSGSWLLREPVW